MEGPGPHPSNLSTRESSDGHEGPGPAWRPRLCGVRAQAHGGLFKEGAQPVGSPPGLWEGTMPVGLVLSSHRSCLGTGCDQMLLLIIDPHLPFPSCSGVAGLL